MMIQNKIKKRKSILNLLFKPNNQNNTKQQKRIKKVTIKKITYKHFKIHR